MRLVFLGTPEFAVPVLSCLFQAGHQIVAVVTQPDARKGRSSRLLPSPIKEQALQLGLPVYAFPNIKTAEASQQLEQFRADVMVTAAYGQILSRRNLNAANYGVINAHASLLPKYRGAAPANFAIIYGETETGITTILTDSGIDSGDILQQRSIAIRPDETAGELLVRLSRLAAKTMADTLISLEQGTCPPRPQNHREATHYPLLKKEDGRIDFSRSAQEIHNRVRGVDPWPGAYGFLDGVQMKFFSPRVMTGAGSPGEILSFSAKEGMVIATGDCAVRFLQVQPMGKKKMSDTDFVRGKRGMVGRFSSESQ